MGQMSTKSRFYILAVISIVILPGCGSRHFVMPDPSSYDVVLKVNYFHQKSESLCGFACLEMVADYYDHTLDARYSGLLEKEAKETGGITAASMKACMDNSGFDTAVFPGTLNNKDLQGIYRHLDLKRPLIILMTERKGDIGHYIVLTGYESKTHMIAAINPGNGYAVVNENDILPVWKEAGFLTVLALPK